MTGMPESTDEKEAELRAAVERCCKLGEAYSAGDSEAVANASKEISDELESGGVATWESLYGCVITGVPGGEFLTTIYVKAATNPLFARRMPDLCRLAGDGNKQALDVIGALLAGVGGSRESVRLAKKAVELAAAVPDKRPLVIEALARAYKEYSDQATLLATLGMVAERGANSADAAIVLACLRDGLTAGLASPTGQLLTKSALAGYLCVPQLWMVADVIMVVKVLSNDVVPRLQPVVGRLSAEARAALSANLQQLLVESATEDATKKTAIQALKLMCDEASVEQIEKIRLAASSCKQFSQDFGDYFAAVAAQTKDANVGGAAFDALLDMKNTVFDSRTKDVFRKYLCKITDSSYLKNKARQLLETNNLEGAELLLERRCAVLAQSERGANEHVECLLKLAETCAKLGKLEGAREARRAVIAVWEQTKNLKKPEFVGKLADMARDCYGTNDAPEAERICKRALEVIESLQEAPTDSAIACLKLLHEITVRQGRFRDASLLERRLARLAGTDVQTDEIERAMRTYVSLPGVIDVQLRPDGLSLDTDDFPRLIKESSGLDMRKYFIDAFKEADFLSGDQKQHFARDLFRIFETVNAFSSNPEFATMHRTEVTEVFVPEPLSQGWVQKMTIDTNVSFRLVPNPPDEASFSSVTGISFHVGGKIIALSDLNLKALDGKCIITPTLNEKSQLPQSGSAIDLLMNAGKDLLVGVLIKMGKISTALPIVMEDFRQYLADAMRFKALLHDHDKDLVAFFERTANITVDDPITRSLLSSGMRLIKNDDTIEIERSRPSKCELGGIALDIAQTVKLKLAKVSHEMRIEKLAGVGIEIPFDPPSELAAIGLDLKRSLPNKITSLSMSGPDAEERRRMVVGTAPGCWVGVDLAKNMQPSLDNEGNWMVFGVTHNPISGAPQKFFVRLDQSNNLKMTTREIADLVTQTAIEGFDPADPSTWKWGAVALGGQTLLTAGSVTRKQARNFGRFLGWIMKGGSDSESTADSASDPQCESSANSSLHNDEVDVNRKDSKE